MHKDVIKVLLTEEQIKARVKELGKQINDDYKDKNLLMVSVLKGSVIFISDLMRAVDCYMKVDFMSVSTYCGGIKTTGVVKILKDLDMDIDGYDVLLVEDILDSGLTLNYIRELLTKRNPRSIKIATLLNKSEQRKIDIQADYIGFDLPDEFVIGYGLDYDEKYRNLPYIGVLDPVVYTT